MKSDFADKYRTDILKNGYKIIQDSEKFCFGIDAVLLSDYAKVRNNFRILDLCTGNGIVPLLLANKGKDIFIDGLEIQKECAEMAAESVLLNSLENVIKIQNGDLKQSFSYYKKNYYDLITCNPPYMLCKNGKQNPDDFKAIARHEVLCTFDDIASVVSKLLKSKGSFVFVHRPLRLPELFVTLNKYNLEPKRMQLVYPFADKEPNLVLIEAIKDASPELRIDKPLIVRNSDLSYTSDLLNIYGEI